jgi:hypothetical protein
MPITVQGRLSHHLDRGPAAPAETGMSWLPHLPRPIVCLAPSTLPAALPYQSTRPFFPPLIDPFNCSLARPVSQSVSQSVNQSISQSISITHCLPCPVMPRLDHSLLPVLLLLLSSPPGVVPGPSQPLLDPSVPCRTSELVWLTD